MSFLSLQEQQIRSVKDARTARRVQSDERQSTFLILPYLGQSTLTQYVYHCRALAQSESEGDGPESEEEETIVNPYPLENKYTDEYDREQCVGSSVVSSDGMKLTAVQVVADAGDGT